MAQVNIELSHDCNMFELKIHKKCDELYKDFEKKWENILIGFEGQFLNNGYIIADYDGIEISTSSFPTVDDGKPNFDRAVCKFLENSKEWTGDSFGTGQKGYPDEFYHDLYELLTFYYHLSRLGYDDSISNEIIEAIKKDLEDKSEISFFCGNAVVVGYGGYYSLSVSLRTDGLSIHSDFYDDEEDEYEDW
tara:strand:- start:2641 stop:3213 length:573 start_codon:yes stop_codon:yes gene_type:complete